MSGKKEVNPLINLAAGGVSGAVSKTITAPLEKVKLAIQNQAASLEQSAMREGLGARSDENNALAERLVQCVPSPPRAPWRRTESSIMGSQNCGLGRWRGANACYGRESCAT